MILIFKVPLILEKKASLATISGQDLGLPNIERITSWWVLALTVGSPDVYHVAHSQLLSQATYCLKPTPKIRMLSTAGCVCVFVHVG